MCSFKVIIGVLAVSAMVMAAPGGRGGQQGGQGGFGGGPGGNQGGRGGPGGQGGPGGNQGGFGGPGGQQGPGGHHGGPQGPPPPPFLQNVTDEGRKAFFDIVSNENLTISEIETQTAAWAETYGVSAQYTEFQANQTALQAEIKQNVTTVVGNLSSVASQLDIILENKDQTREAQKEAIDALRQQYPVEVDTLFFIAMPQGGPRGGPKGPGGPGGPGGRHGGPHGGRRGDSSEEATTESA